ncbi:SH3 domain-containing protein, partial [Synechococcus sp. PCC 7335]|uniref:glycoside hydrolase family protein n=1 Tax=Synechococcus sp. (strain ATCC 29403 / PCC 7335) TaxID=91464 RepID=UPI0012F8E120
MKRMTWVYRSFLQGILIGLFFVFLLSPNSGQIFPDGIERFGISFRVLDQSIFVLIFSGILGGLLYTIVVDGLVELPKFTSRSGDTFKAGLFGDLLIGVAGALVFEYLTTTLVITSTGSTAQAIDVLPATQLKLVAARGIIGGYGGRAIMNMALKKFLNKIDKLEIEKSSVVEKTVTLEQGDAQLKQQLAQAEDEKITIQTSTEAPSAIAPRKPPVDYDITTIEQILEAEVDGGIHTSKWSLELTQAIYFALIKLGFLDPSDTLEKVADGWKIFKESINQNSPDMIGTGSAQSLVTALQASEESTPHQPVISSYDVAGISDSAISLIKTSEGFRSKAYADPGHGWSLTTIGYGTTKYPPDGSPVKRGDTISVEKAEKCLKYQLEHDFKPALEKIPTWPRMNSNQQGALYSFAYNLGKGFYQGHNFDSITDLCDHPDWWEDAAKVKQIFVLYNKSNGKVMPGLVTRRQAEADLFCQPALSNKGTALVEKDHQPSQLLKHCYVSDPNPPLNVRSGPGTRFEKVDTLANDSRVTVTGEDAGWLQITHPVNGWIFEKNTSKFLMRLTSDDNPPTNVRSGPGQHFDVVHKLDNGTSIRVIDEKEGWLQLAGPVDGWISRKLVISSSRGISASPAPASMSEAQKYEQYRQLVLAVGGKFRESANQRNLIGFRKETSTRANSGRGEYDDLLFMVWKSGVGQYQLREYSFCTEPSGQYEHRSKLPHRRHPQGVDANSDGWRDLGRIPSGYYEYRKWSSSLFPRALRVTAEIMAERDTDHDGIFEPHEPRAGEQQSMLFHAGGHNNTFSAGCQT